MKNRFIINSPAAISDLIGHLRELFKETKFFTVTINTGKKRTLALNSLSHAWYTQVAKEEREYTDEEVKCLCKLHFGVPILRGEDEDYNNTCVQLIDPLTYEGQLIAMKVYPCTSKMNTKQFCRYLEQVQAHYAGRVKLEFPEEQE